MARQPNDGYGSFVVALLDSHGRCISTLGVPLDESAAGTASIASNSTGNAIVVVPTGDPDRPHAYHWFAVTWPEDRLAIRGLGRWSHGQVRTAPPIMRTNRGETIVAGHDPVGVTDGVGPLAYAFGTVYPPDRLATTGLIAVTGFDALPIASNRAVAALALGRREIALYSWNPTGQTHLGAVTKPPAKVEVGGPRLTERSDGIGVFWQQYNGRIRRTERDSSLFFATYDPTTPGLSSPTRLTADREVPVEGWHLVEGRRQGLLVWKEGLIRRKQVVRLVTFERLGDLPRGSEPLDLPFPDAVVETDGGPLALWSEFTRTPYSWTLRTAAL
jgi:hypothetical protein